MSELKHGIILPNWEVGGDTERLVEFGVAAEEAGWDGVFLADHLAMGGEDGHPDFPDPWITLSGIAARTDEIKLGSWVTPIPRRQPWQLARDLATLDRLSNGRVILGTGLGRSFDYTTYGDPWDPKTLSVKYDEALDIITGLHYRGDGVMPAEGFDREETGDLAIPERPHSPKVEVREMAEYYHSLLEDPKELFLPTDPPHATKNWIDFCRDVGATWVYTRNVDPEKGWTLTMERIQKGPPE